MTFALGDKKLIEHVTELHPGIPEIVAATSYSPAAHFKARLSLVNLLVNGHVKGAWLGFYGTPYATKIRRVCSGYELRSEERSVTTKTFSETFSETFA